MQTSRIKTLELSIEMEIERGGERGARRENNPIGSNRRWYYCSYCGRGTYRVRTMGFANPAAGASIIQIPPHSELLVAQCACCCDLSDNDDDRPSMKHQNEIDCEMALVVAFVVIIHARNIMEKKGFANYMTNMFPPYSLFAFVVLNMVMYGGNIYF